MELPHIVLLLLAALNLITFCLYGADKSRAKRGAWRIPERTLLLFSLFGGGVGGFAAMHLFHHKTKHWYFVAVNALGLLLTAGLTVFLLLKI